MSRWALALLLLWVALVSTASASIAARNATALEASQQTSSVICGSSTADLLAWGLDTGVIDADQHSRLLVECQRRVAVEEQTPGAVREVIMAVSSRFTLLNVLYFFGALLVIGAMTLFMTIGWESFGGWGIFTIAVMYGAIFAMVGRSFWNPAGGEWNLLGGLLYTMTISMTPLAVYGFERATGLWVGNNPGLYSDYYRYVKSTWLPMEVATCIVGAVTLYFVRFPFLTMPVSVTLWLMSMDIVPIIFRKSFWGWQDRAKVSMYFGAAVLGGAYYVDRWLGCSDDFAFWFYLSGLATFWGGLTTQESKHEAGGVVYLAINAFLLVLAQVLDRSLLALFGFVGVILYCYSIVSKMQIEYTLYIYLRGLLGLVLLLAAYRWDTTAAYWASLVVIGSFNILIGVKGINHAELFHILRLILNMGLYEGSSVFAGRQLSLLLFNIDAQYPLALVAGLSMLAFHVTLVNASRYFVAYRLVLCYAAMFCTVYFPGLFFFGALGIVIYVVTRTRGSYHFFLFSHAMFHYFLGVSLVVMSELFQSRIVYYLGLCVCGSSVFGGVTRPWFRNPRKGAVFCLASVLVILISVLFESQCLIVIGGIGVFSYLSYLAYEVFRNSLLFPFALTGMGVGVLFLGIQYQKHQEWLRAALVALLPSPLLDVRNLAAVKYGPPAWAQQLVWLPAAVERTAGLPDAAFLWTIAGVAALVVVSILLEKLFHPPINRDSKLRVLSCQVLWPQDTDHHGLTFVVSGNKPTELALSQAYLYVEGPQVWSHFERNIGHTAVTAFRYAFHPLRLCPSYMDPDTFQHGKTTWKAEIRLGTGHNGTQRVSHLTLLQRLRTLRDSGDPNVSLLVVSRSGFLWRKRQLLFEIHMKASTLVSAHDSHSRRAALPLIL